MSLYGCYAPETHSVTGYEVVGEQYARNLSRLYDPQMIQTDESVSGSHDAADPHLGDNATPLSPLQPHQSEAEVDDEPDAARYVFAKFGRVTRGQLSEQFGPRATHPWNQPVSVSSVLGGAGAAAAGSSGSGAGVDADGYASWSGAAAMQSLVRVDEAHDWFFGWLVSSSSISRFDINTHVLAHILQSPTSPTLCTLSNSGGVLHPWSRMPDHSRIDFATFNRWWSSSDAYFFRRRNSPLLHQFAQLWANALTLACKRVTDAALAIAAAAIAEENKEGKDELLTPAASLAGGIGSPQPHLRGLILPSVPTIADLRQATEQTHDLPMVVKALILQVTMPAQSSSSSSSGSGTTPPVSRPPSHVPSTVPLARSPLLNPLPSSPALVPSLPTTGVPSTPPPTTTATTATIETPSGNNLPPEIMYNGASYLLPPASAAAVVTDSTTSSSTDTVATVTAGTNVESKDISLNRPLNRGLSINGDAKSAAAILPSVALGADGLAIVDNGGEAYANVATVIAATATTPSQSNDIASPSVAAPPVANVADDAASVLPGSSIPLHVLTREASINYGAAHAQIAAMARANSMIPMSAAILAITPPTPMASSSSSSAPMATMAPGAGMAPSAAPVVGITPRGVGMSPRVERKWSSSGRFTPKRMLSINEIMNAAVEEEDEEEEIVPGSAASASSSQQAPTPSHFQHEWGAIPMEDAWPRSLDANVTLSAYLWRLRRSRLLLDCLSLLPSYAMSGTHGDDWNTRFLSARCMPDSSPDKFNRLTEIATDFVRLAGVYGKPLSLTSSSLIIVLTCLLNVIGRLVIAEIFLPDEARTLTKGKFGGVAGGDKFTVHGILFKLAADKDMNAHSSPPRWIYGGHQEGLEYAGKAAAHELKSAVQYLNANAMLPNHAQIHVPLYGKCFAGSSISALDLLLSVCSFSPLFDINSIGRLPWLSSIGHAFVANWSSTTNNYLW
jgi:hypothetical protein